MIKFYLTILFTLLISSVASAGEEELLREYFFYRCVNEGHSELELSEHDGSAGYSAELLSSSFTTIKMVSNYAKKTAVDISASAHGNKKNVLWGCLETYNSEELKSVISMAVSAK